MKDDIQAARRALMFLDVVYDKVFRIMMLVQENQEFFNAIPGDDALELVADLLEDMIEEGARES